MALVAQACGGGSSPERSDPTIARATTTTGRYDVPEVIDEAYVNRVLAGLNAVEGDVLRITMERRAYTDEADRRLRAIYEEDDEFDFAVDAYTLEVIEGFPGVRPDPGDVAVSVVELVATAPSCILAEVTYDTSETALDPEVVPSGNWVVLVPSSQANDPYRLNATGWAYAYNRTSSAPPGDDRCAT